MRPPPRGVYPLWYLITLVLNCSTEVGMVKDQRGHTHTANVERLWHAVFGQHCFSPGYLYKFNHNICYTSEVQQKVARTIITVHLSLLDTCLKPAQPLLQKEIKQTFNRQEHYDESSSG